MESSVRGEEAERQGRRLQKLREGQSGFMGGAEHSKSQISGLFLHFSVIHLAPCSLYYTDLLASSIVPMPNSSMELERTSPQYAYDFISMI